MQTQRVEPEHSSSDFEWETLRERVENGTIDEIAFFSVPAGAMYRPPEMKVNNTGKIDFLGKSQVISSLDAADTFVGFVGAKVDR